MPVLRVGEKVPEVTVLELPDDPMGYADTLRACPLFERLRLSSEDRERGPNTSCLRHTRASVPPGDGGMLASWASC